MTKESFQNALQHFTFGITVKTNLIFELMDPDRYSLTGSQSWCLCRTLPYIVEFVPFGSEVRELSLLLSKICDIVMFHPSSCLGYSAKYIIETSCIIINMKTLQVT